MSELGKVAITGAATTEFARSIPGKTTTQLKIEAAMGAIADAGLTKDEIDGIIIMEGGGTGGNPRTHMEFSEYMGMFPKGLCTSVPVGGASAGFALEIARWAIGTGRCRNVLTVAGGKESGAGRSALGHGMVRQLHEWPGHSPTYEQHYGPLLPTYYGAAAHRHMHEFGTTSHQLAAVAVACRKHASLNPNAVYRNPITIEDVLNSRMISSPLHMLDCCVVSDGALAFVLSSAEEARSRPKKPVWVLGTGGGYSSYFMGSLCIGIPGDPNKRYDLVRTVAGMAADKAFAEAGVERKDIDFVTLCDNFTITPIVLLEDFGFCAKGEGGPFVEGGRIELGGELPLNPHGGLLSCNHAGTEYQNFVEATLQLRGEAGARQVKGAKIALANSSAAVISTHQVAILAAD